MISSEWQQWVTKTLPIEVVDLRLSHPSISHEITIICPKKYRKNPHNGTLVASAILNHVLVYYTSCSFMRVAAGTCLCAMSPTCHTCLVLAHHRQVYALCSVPAGSLKSFESDVATSININGTAADNTSFSVIVIGTGSAKLAMTDLASRAVNIDTSG